MASKSLFLLVSLIIAAMMFCPTSNAEDYDVSWHWWGGHVIPHVWLDSQDIRIGDRLVFIFSTDYDNMLQVTRENYEACNIRNPIARWDTNDYSHPVFFDVTEYGHLYFISGMPGACEDGMRIQIYVRDPHSSAPVQSPSSEPSPSSAPVHSPSPGSSPSSAPVPSSSSFSN